ncbi:MAG: hypothetical protein J7L23_02430 [Candidatus Diapherotrites archaeon]|nr:hypothetical protein [Candidatus Diapherotrites archaeon]
MGSASSERILAREEHNALYDRSIEEHRRPKFKDIQTITKVRAFSDLFGVNSRSKIKEASLNFLKDVDRLRKTIRVDGKPISHREFIERVVKREYRERPEGEPYIKKVVSTLADVQIDGLHGKDLEVELSKHDILRALTHYKNIMGLNHLETAVKHLLENQSNR